MTEKTVGSPIIEVSDSTFEEAVLKSSVPVIVDFWAPWCTPCRMVAPMLEEIAKDYVGQVVVARINTDENPTRAVQYGVRGIPTLLFIKAGQEVDRQVGAVPRRVITDKLSAMLAW